MGGDSEKLTEKLNDMGLDIREILTSMKHINKQFEATNEEIREIKKMSRENQESVTELKLELSKVENNTSENTDDIGNIYTKFKERDRKMDNDRKWLIGTVISVVLMFISLITLIISLV